MGTSLLKAFVICCACTFIVNASAQSITYQWLNVGCANTITCDGCTACNLPENTSPNFFGTNVIWVGVDACPFPTEVAGINSMFSIGWPMFPNANNYTMLTGIATVPMQVDSIILRHARTTTGPDRLRVSFSASPMEPFQEIADQYVDWNFQHTVITDLGCLEIPEGSPYATFQLKMQAYEGTSEGAWVLDEVRIVGSPCSDISTGIQERFEHRADDPKPYVDVLGRPVSGANVAPGVYLGGKRVVTIF